MATLSQAEIDAILDVLCIGILKRLNHCHPAQDVVEVNSHVDEILKRFTSVDALVGALLKRNPSNQAPAQAVFEPEHIVDDCHAAEDAGDAHRSVDAIVDNYHPVGDIVTSVDASGQHAEPDLIVDDRYPADVDDCHSHSAGDVMTSIDNVVLSPQINDRHPDSTGDAVTLVDALCQHAKDVYTTDEAHCRRDDSIALSI